MNQKQIETSMRLLGGSTVEMLTQVHKDALWILENLGVGCKQPEMQEVFRRFESDGEAIVFNIDVRTAGKDYEEFFTRIKDDGNVIYVRGKPARIIKEKAHYPGRNGAVQQ